MGKYNNFIFDLYGTLLDIRTEEYDIAKWDEFAKWLSRQGINYKKGKKVKAIYDREVKRLSKRPSGHAHLEIDIIPVFAKICRKRVPEYTDEQVWSAAEQFRRITTIYVRPYPNTIKMLDGLKKAGKNVYLLSNAQRAFTWQELVETGLEPYFDDIFISSDCGCKKPDPDFMNMLISKHKLSIAESIMVGNDSACDVGVANAVGMDAAYLKTEISPENDPMPDCAFICKDGDIGCILDLI